jgi:excisionase family DNA binding protein
VTESSSPHPPKEGLETPKQLAKRVGLSVGKVRRLIAEGKLEHVPIGARLHVPAGAFERFIEANKVTTCQDVTRDQSFGGSQNAASTTSPGPSAAAAVSAQRARMTAQRLKTSSPNGSKLEGGKSAQVIRLKS